MGVLSISMHQHNNHICRIILPYTLLVNINIYYPIIIIPFEFMNSENQSSSLALGENLTPSTIISHPGTEHKKFYIALNPLNRSGTSQLSVVEHDKQQPQLSHHSLPFQQYIKQIHFVQDQLLIHSVNNENKTHLSLLKESEIEAEKREIKDINYKFEEELRNVIVYKDGILGQSERELFHFDLEKESKTGIFTFEHQIDFSTIDIVHDNLILCASNSKRQIQVIDQQAKAGKYLIENIGNSDVLGIHFNPIKQYNFMAVFEDCFKIWDMRKTNLPLKCHDNHHSLLLNGKYNCTYDELILTSYDDGTLGLFRINSGTSVASKIPSANKDQEGLVKLYDEHEDSAYCISWASFTPWIFASVSYNGNLIINEIPSALKVRILY